MATAVVDDKLLKYITDTIVERFHPRRIILFGSRARGDARPDSDVDLLVEMESDKSFYQRGYEVELLFAPRNWSMDLLVFTPEELAERRDWSFFRTVANEGKTLYERPWPAAELDGKNFLVIQACLGTGDIKPWDMIAFHAQQGAEKYLKAFLVSRMPGDPPRTHDLPTLLSQCTAFEHSLSALGADCVLLNQHAIGPRYPGMPEPSASDALAAVAAAERIRTEIRQRLGMENV